MSVSRIAIDPVTRIEGHLRIEAAVDGGRVSDAWSSSTMFRGMEIVLRKRDPRDAWLFAQRICGVCTTVHALASVRAVEDALGVTPPPNARLIRDIIAGTQNVQDHVIHFYHLHAFDWIDVKAATGADPAATARLAQSISAWPKSSAGYFKAVRDTIAAIVNSDQPSLFANGYWGHPAYRLAPEANLLLVAHYLQALEWQVEMIRVQAILGGKNPHPQTYLVGGMALPIDPNSQAALNFERLDQQRSILERAKAFVEGVYLPDSLLVAAHYPEWFEHGAGHRTYMSYGDFPTAGADVQTFRYARGIVRPRKGRVVEDVDQAKIGEYVTRSWYTYADGNAGRHPFDGETTPGYTGPQPPYEFLTVEEKYSWLKAPRYGQEVMEVGPLARLLVSYAAGRDDVKTMLDAALKHLHIPLKALSSTLGRVVARALESQLMAGWLLEWHDELSANIGAGDLAVHDGSRWEPSTWPTDCEGWGAHEAPRGSLGHWVRIKHGAIENYQAVMPTTWNASPRDERGVRGPYEASLIGTPVADRARPLEILRTVHSFDPCMACAVHVLDPSGRVVVRVDGEQLSPW
jgi:Ni,Fe-hydrogenase I large subunit